jgi:phosphomevalonate kinase
MTARAPGKLLLSGAYAVLRGAPAVVTAVQRYAFADATSPPALVTPEVQTALANLLADGLATGPLDAPWFDASQLRERDRKLGLGSSAAILVASLWETMANLPGYGDRSSLDLRETIFERALIAHRTAQGGGSGVDIAASTYGGTMVVRRNRDELYLEATPLPQGLVIEVYAMPESASTSEFVAKVLRLAEEHPAMFEATFGAQVAASHQAADALRMEDGLGFLQGLRAQHDALLELGRRACLPIVLPEVNRLHRTLPDDACFLPSGAGGGDVSLFVGFERSPAQFREGLRAQGIRPLALALDAPGSGLVLEADRG